MKLEKIFIRNFRSVGEKGLEVTLAPTWTTFIGENNVGKSSIFEAIKRVLEPEVAWDVEDWYAGDQNKTIEIRLECILDSNQIKQIIEILKLPVKLEDFRVSFNNKLTYGFRKALGQSSYFLKLGEINIQNDSGWIGEIDQNSSYTPVSWQEIITEIKHQKSKNSIQIIKEILDKKKQSSIPTRINFGINILGYLIGLIYTASQVIAHKLIYLGLYTI